MPNWKFDCVARACVGSIVIFLIAVIPRDAGAQLAGIDGAIRYYSNGEAVSDATVQLTGPVPATGQTDAAGHFAFAGLTHDAWQVQPQKLGDAGNAISVLDAVYVLQALMGVRTLSAAAQLACDVSGNGVLSVYDAVLILQYMAGLITRFPVAQTCGSDWVFLPMAATAPNQVSTDPQITTDACTPGAISFAPLVTQAANEDFAAIVFGDCSGNWQPTTPSAIPTLRPTATPTMSATSTASATLTVTQAASASATPSNTLLPTVTATRTATASPTRTETSTPTPTPSLTATLTPTASPTLTSTRTATASPTRTPTVTATPTPTTTWTPSPTASATRTPTRTPTRTATSTRTPTVTATATAPATPAGSPSGPTIGGCQVFPADNPWNRDISADPVDTNSPTYVANINLGATYLHPDFGSPAEYGIPYVVVPGTQSVVPITFIDYGDESDPGPYPVPSNAPVEAGSDHHVLVLNSGTCVLYELYNASKDAVGTGWSASSGAIFDLHSNALRPDSWTSADAAGLPILPGLVRYDEVASGAINHAVRFTVWRAQHAWVHPATHYGVSSDPNFIPMGGRLRLQSSYDISHFTGAARVILTALKKYGMIVADAGTSWYITGATDPRWDDDDLDQLKTVPGSAFEVVQLGTIFHP